MKNESTLIILVPGFPANEEDTTCLPAIQDLIRAINREFPSIKLKILSFQYPFQKASYSWFENPVTAFGGKNRGGFSRRYTWWRVRQELSRIKKENQLIGILSFWLDECAWVGKKWADKHGFNHFVWMMGQDVRKENRFVNWLKPKGNELIVLSDFLANECLRNHQVRPAHVIPQGVEPTHFTKAEIKRDIDLLCCGSLIPLKQYHLCIEIVKELKKEMPAIRAVICGKGPEENNLRQLIKTYSLEGNIELTGEKKYDEVLALMKSSKVFLHPSSYEGFGAVCLEALASGMPVISFTKPMNEMIDGWFVVKDLNEMKEKTINLLREGKIREPVFPFTSKAAARKVMNLYPQPLKGS